MFRIFNRKTLVALIIFLTAISIYFVTFRSQGEVGSISIDTSGDRPVIAIPAGDDGAIAWMEGLFATDVPTNTPIPTLTPTKDKTHRPTKTLTPTQSHTPTGPTPTTKPTKTKGPSPTPTFTDTPTATATTHAYFTGYQEPIALINTSGSSKDVATLYIKNRLYLVIADGSRGLQIIDTTDRNNPISLNYRLPEANAVEVINTTAYVAAGNDGVVILDLTTPLQPIAVDLRKTISSALDLDVAFLNRTTEDKATGKPFSYTLTRIFVALGEDGMQVIDLYPIDSTDININTQKKSIFNKFPVKPVLLRSGDEALAVEGYQYTQDAMLVFVADGKNGVQILNLSTDTLQKIRHKNIIRTIDIPYAWDTAFGRLLEHRKKNDKQIYWLFVAAGEDGVFSYKVDFGDDPDHPTFEPYSAIDTPGEARAVTLYHNNIFVGDGEGGLQVIDFNDPDHPKLIGNGRYEFNWTMVPVTYAIKEWLWKNVDSPGSATTIAYILLDSLLCLLSLGVMVFILAGLVLPARTGTDRLRVIGRIIANLFNEHGPVWVIEDGRARYRTPPEKRHGLGVTLQDPNSAVLLGRHRNRRRTSGEQLTFTGPDEHLIWQTELRRRSLILGPRGDDPNPFYTRGEKEERADYRARQYRRRLTAGKTSDGIEVVPTLRVIFSREGPKPDEQNEFGYGPQSITEAYHGDNPPASVARVAPAKYAKRRQAIEKRLEHVVSEVWKLCLSKYSLAELFPLPSSNSQTCALDAILTEIRNILVEEQISIFDKDEYKNFPNLAALREDYREIMGESKPQSKDSAKGWNPDQRLRVHEVALDAIYLSDEDLDNILWNWIDDWRQGNPPSSGKVQAKRDHDTLIRFAEYAVSYFVGIPSDQPLSQRLADNLVNLLRGTLRALPVNSDEYQRLARVIRELGGRIP